MKQIIYLFSGFFSLIMLTSFLLNKNKPKPVIIAYVVIP